MGFTRNILKSHPKEYCGREGTLKNFIIFRNFLHFLTMINPCERLMNFAIFSCDRLIYFESFFAAKDRWNSLIFLATDRKIYPIFFLIPEIDWQCLVLFSATDCQIQGQFYSEFFQKIKEIASKSYKKSIISPEIWHKYNAKILKILINGRWKINFKKLFKKIVLSNDRK